MSHMTIEEERIKIARDLRVSQAEAIQQRDVERFNQNKDVELCQPKK